MNKSTESCHCHPPEEEQHSDCDCDREPEHHHHDPEPRKIHLTLTDGKELECAVLDIFDIDEKSYIALLPHGSETALLYGFSESHGEPRLNKIEDDEEYQAASRVFTERQQGE